jgi:PPM family protein phosphatase
VAVELHVASATFQGRRSYQQDDLLVRELDGGALVAVADGMGGHAAGEVASLLTREALRVTLTDPRLLSEPAVTLGIAAETANRAILAHAEARPETAGLGSTLVACVISGSEVLVGHAGDSRAYLVTPDEVVQLTKDHSAVQDALDHGTLTEDQVASFPYRNAILRHLGDLNFPGLDYAGPRAVPAGSVILASSDGAHSHLYPADLLEHIAGTADLAIALDHLLRLAYHRASDDNITLAACEVGAFPRSKVPAQTPPPLPLPSGAGR